MANKVINEFEEARKKRRKKFAAERTGRFIVTSLAIIIIFGGIYFFVKADVAGIIGDRIAANVAGEGKLPVDMSGTTVVDTFAVGEHLGILTDAVYMLYTESGKQLLSARHGFANPMVETAERRFLIYDQGGNKLLIRTRDKILLEKEFEDKIISADLSAGGTLSVVTSAQRYASRVSVFNESYSEEVFTWNASGEYVVCAGANKNTKTVAAAALSSNESGEIVTTVHVFTTEAALELSKCEFKNSAVLDIEYDKNGNIKVICDNISACINSDGSILGSYTYKTVPATSINIDGNNGAMLVFDRFTESRTAEAVFLDENLNIIKSTSVNGKYICSDGNFDSTVIYCSGSAYVFSRNGDQTAVYEKEKDATLLKLLHGKLFAITRNELTAVEQ